MINSSIERLVFCGKKLHNIIDIERNYLKNLILLFFIGFLSFFTYCSLKSLDSIKTQKIEIMAVELPPRNIELENRIKKATAGFPIENMSRFIALEDEKTAAFMVAIAKKESNWGKRTPKLNGEECNNFWGFRQKRERMGSGGHTCFDNQRDAVKSVAERVKNLIESGIDTPEKMVVWKCGYSCEAHNPESVSKWIEDVEFYYNKF
ncbi:MAG: hypothetical protein UR60_C0017G0018 [Candidatus Moranbacteria bacterium GW2011_GWF2_34_56]|nr:MAG: hypothetical protein UR51_C0015G0019 [Candidatus Moranbacteria bacterium GW2011_GWF1_34_10]KKP64680.1 MAG: hypothetical protein UR60_C0017G0018 [Candidatus Moranbacteria bacterium GW2011_GWF2_34_56]